MSSKNINGNAISKPSIIYKNWYSLMVPCPDIEHWREVIIDKVYKCHKDFSLEDLKNLIGGKGEWDVQVIAYHPKLEGEFLFKIVVIIK